MQRYTCKRCGNSRPGPRTHYPDVGPVCDPCLRDLGAPTPEQLARQPKLAARLEDVGAARTSRKDG
jgi:hypothetical protein